MKIKCTDILILSLLFCSFTNLAISGRTVLACLLFPFNSAYVGENTHINHEMFFEYGPCSLNRTMQPFRKAKKVNVDAHCVLVGLRHDFCLEQELSAQDEPKVWRMAEREFPGYEGKEINLSAYVREAVYAECRSQLTGSHDWLIEKRFGHCSCQND